MFPVMQMGKKYRVVIYTDGACSGNPGPGGWAAVMSLPDIPGKVMELSGGEKETTNNRMELTAVIEALSALKSDCDVTVYTDSSYVANAVTKGWINSWKKKGWKKADGKSVLNIDLWQRFYELYEKYHPEFIWIKGHAGTKENERCDTLAVEQSMKFRQ